MDLSDTIEAKSDQMNAIDLIMGPRTITVTSVKKVADKKQPVFIYYEGDNGKPYKPCLGMRRILITEFGKDGKWEGKQITVFNEPTVVYAGKEEGGIEVSNLSGLDGPKKHKVVLTRGKFKIVTIYPIEEVKLNPLSDEALAAIEDVLSQAESMADLQKTKKRIDAGKYDADGTAKTDAAYKEALTRVREASEATAE